MKKVSWVIIVLVICLLIIASSIRRVWDWKTLPLAIINAARSNNPEKLLELTLIDASDIGSKEEYDKEEYLAETRERVQIFLASYKDLFDGNLRLSQTAEFPSNGELDVRAMILWVEKEGKFYGIMIPLLVNTKKGVKVGEWVSLSGYELYNNISKKRAILEASKIEDCKYPQDGITYQNVYVNDSSM